MGPATPLPYLAVARALSPHGVRGELRCQILTDFPERFAQTRRLFAVSSEPQSPDSGSQAPLRGLDVERSRLVPRGVILKFAGVDSRADAASLVGELLFIPESEAVSLPPDTYFWYQIVGLNVQTVAGEDLGRVVEILPTGSNDVYVVRDGAREVLVPAVGEVVRGIDLERGLIVIEPLEGMLG